MLGNIERMLAYSKQKKQNDRDFMFCFEDLVEFELDEAKKVCPTLSFIHFAKLTSSSRLASVIALS